MTAANPQRRAVDFSIENVDRVQVAGDYGFVSHRDAKELSIIDFSAPTNPRLLGGYTSTNLVIDLALEGSLGFSLEYLADDIPGILRIIDFSDPANPLVKSSHETESPVNLSWMPLFGKLAVCPGRVFVLAYHSLNSSDRTGGVEIFNISNLENPMRIGRYSMPPSGVPTVPVNFAVRDNFLYLIRAGGFRGAAVPECCGFGLELEIVDMEDPLSPVALSSHAFGQGFSTSTHEVDASVALLKDHAFVLDPEGVITIFDISRPTEIKPVGSYHSLLIPPFGLTLAGSRLYLHSSTKLEVLDIRDPENPKHIGGNSNLDLQVAPNRTFSLAVRSGQIFAPAGASGLLILHDYKPLHFEQVIRNNSGTAHLRLSGPPGVPGAVQRSSDLRHWNDWLQVNFSEDVTELSDVKNENVSANFYRIVAP